MPASGDDLDKMIAMSEEARSRLGWDLLADYMSLQGRGLRKPALEVLDKFVEVAAESPFEDRLTLALWMLAGLDTNKVAAPLSWKIIQPTCREWLTREPENPQAHLWFANLNLGDVEAHYRKVLELDPGCDEARGSLCNILTGDIWFNQHHLPDYYIKSPLADLLDLAEAEAIWIGHDTSKTAVYWLNEIAQYRLNAEAWLKDHPPSEAK